jgi:hypothetical protein
VDCGRRKHKAHRPYLLTRYFPEDGNESQIQWSGYVQPGVMRDAGRPTTLQLNFAVLLLGFLSELLLAPADGPWYSKEIMWSLLKSYTSYVTRIMAYDRNSVGVLLYCTST